MRKKIDHLRNKGTSMDAFTVLAQHMGDFWIKKNEYKHTVDYIRSLFEVRRTVDSLQQLLLRTLGLVVSNRNSARGCVRLRR